VAIVVIEDQKVLTVKKADFQKEKLEEFLQKSIADNPEIIDLKELNEDLIPLILGTEFDCVDVLGIDQYGNIYVIETKLFKNPDKRFVVAQVLDYGASLWRDYGNGTREATEEFWGKAKQRFQALHPGDDLDDKLKELVTPPANGDEADQATEAELQAKTDALRKRVEGNLREGRFRFVVVMDKLSDDIKNHIAFLNYVTKDDYWVLGIELEFYNPPKYGNLQIVVPTMFGNESTEKRSIASSQSGTIRDEDSFLDALAKNVSDDVVQVAKELLAWCKDEFKDFHFTPAGTFVPELRYEGRKYTQSPFLVKPVGIMQIYFDMMSRQSPFSDLELRKKLQRMLNDIPDVKIGDDRLAGGPNIELKSLLDPKAMKVFKEAMLWWKEEVIKAPSPEPGQEAVERGKLATD
jgi:hypothetical protein